MELRTNSPYFSTSLRIDKKAMVQTYLDRGMPVVYVSDRFPEVVPAKLISEVSRFSRADLAASLKQKGLRFRGYDPWPEISRFLADRSR